METDDAQIINRLETDINSLSLSKSELRQLCRILQDRAQRAADLQIENVRDALQDREDPEELEADIRDAFRLNLTVQGSDGKELFGSVEEVFNSPNFPKNVKAIYVRSDLRAKETYNFTPQNSFELLLDFSKTNPLNLSIQPINPTPNNSKLEVRGFDATWFNGVFNEVVSFINTRESTLKFIHGHSVYDIFVWGLGIPLAFWTTHRLSTTIESLLGHTSSIVINGAYLYVAVAALMFFRFLFMYARWIWPKVELKGEEGRSIAHRATLSAITISILASFIYDLLIYVIPG